MRKRHFPVVFLSSLLLLGAVSCEEKMIFSFSDDPGYVEEPVVGIRALDGDKWIDGSIDQKSRTVSFEFHTVSSLDNVVCDVALNKNWAKMVSPAQTRLKANLRSGYKITVNDGVDDVTYTLSAAMFQQVKEVKATLGGETITLSSSDNTFSGSFPSAFLMSEVKGVDIDVVLNDDVQLVTNPEALKNIDFSNGNGVEFMVLDKTVDRKRTFTVYANPSDAANFDDTWTELTKSWSNQYGVTFGNVRLYKTSNLLGRSDNPAYALTIPAGYVNMKVAEKYIVGSPANDNIKVSALLRNNRDFVIFLPEAGPGVWHTDGSTSSSGLEYYSPLAYGPDDKGVTRVLRNDGFGGGKKAYAPALGIKDGKVSIKPAGAVDGQLYSYSDGLGNGQAAWDVESAFGGYFQICKDGETLISGDADRFYTLYNSEWRAYGSQMTCFLTPDWATSVPVATYDKLRTGRIGVGCTKDGALVILVSEKYVNTHNQGQHVDDGKNGGSGDNKGLTLYELASAMTALGCSDAMTVEDYNWSFVALQDGTSRGKDLFWTNSRWYITKTNANYGNMKPESSENVNLVVACFK